MKAMKIMKIMKLLTVYCLLIAVSACKGNNKQTLAPEEVKETAAADAPIQSAVVLDTIIPAPGIKYQEARKTDPASPLVTIDLTASYEAKEVDLATIYSSVEYIILKHPLADRGCEFIGGMGSRVMFSKSLIRGAVQSEVYLAGDKLVAGDRVFGYFCFDREGNYLYTLYSPDVLPSYTREENNVHIEYDPDASQILSFSMAGDNCLIQLYDEDTRTGKLLFQNLGNGTAYLSRPYYGEGELYLINSETYIDYRYEIFKTEQLPFMYTFAMQGDTLCSFMNYNSLLKKDRNINYRNPESGEIYRFGDVLTVRQSYNDTIFRISSAHELTPAYRLDMKNKKPDMDAVLYEDGDGSITIQYINETEDFLSVLFSVNEGKSRDEWKSSYCYYDKKEGKTYRPAYRNTLADAIHTPLYMMRTGDNNQLYIGLTKTFLDRIIAQDSFNDRPESQQNKARALAEELQEGEMLVMILK